jgi:hypothetical protein
MNYTSNNPDHEDKPEDWLNSSLIFAQALDKLLKENEGVVVELQGDAKFQFDHDVKKVIVFRHNNQIIIEEADPGLNDGQMCYIHPYNPN